MEKGKELGNGIGEVTSFQENFEKSKYSTQNAWSQYQILCKAYFR